MHVEIGTVTVRKAIWSSPAGKKRHAKRLVQWIPPHSTYVEPFVGSGAVFFEKAPTETEVLSDLDPAIVETFELIQALTPGEIEALKERDWISQRDTWHKVRDSTPEDAVSKVHKFLYLARFSFGRMRGRGYDGSGEGSRARIALRVERLQSRLHEGLRFHKGDYAAVMQQYDSPDTFFFLDPPYVGTEGGVGETQFDEQRFLEVLKTLKGKFLITYGTATDLPQKCEAEGMFLRMVPHHRFISGSPQTKNHRHTEMAVISNYDLDHKTLKAEGRILKAEERGEERFLLGVVLEPETVDAQGDIYSEDAVRKAAHGFMESDGDIGLQHRFSVDGKVKILESYLLPEDARLGTTQVKKGTWLLGVRVLDDDMWQQVQRGELTGFSVGGTAVREQDTEDSDG